MYELNINSGLIGNFKKVNKLNDGIELIRLNQSISENEINMMLKKVAQLFATEKSIRCK